ncbi:glycosyltransferase [Agrobacterium tumefaciens]|nr:glycosyltransferase [Agrobacterium tumefaciens]NTE19001.1 glycosyltransferase [Agrobacterium tumefaciens]
MKPLISVAVCTYNGSLFLEKQLISILNQTYKNIEIVVVDDCSTDNTFEITETLALKYPQIKSFRNTKNIGFNKNFEKAITLTAGEYITISDQDDIWLENKLQKLMDNIKNKWLIFSNSEWMDEDENLLGKQTLGANFNLDIRTFKSFLFYNSVTGHTTLFSKTLLKYILPMPENGYYDWWIGFVASYHNQITCLNECLTLHRIHRSSVMHHFKGEKDKNTKIDRSKEISTNLSIVEKYKYLKESDQKMISEIRSNFDKKGFSIYIVRLIYRYYQDFFPDLKNRKGLSRLNFAIKFAIKSL